MINLTLLNETATYIGNPENKVLILDTINGYLRGVQDKLNSVFLFLIFLSILSMGVCYYLLLNRKLAKLDAILIGIVAGINITFLATIIVLMLLKYA